MMDTESVAKALGYHKRALLRRVSALGSLVTPHVAEGKNGGFLFDDTAIAILRRLSELERDGLSVSTATQRIREELKKPDENGVSTDVASAPTGDTSELVAELRARIREQTEMIAFLKEQLRSRDEQILALTPGPQTDAKNDHSNQRWSRWQGLKMLVLGRI
jgi:hypothetical protein